MYYRKVGQEVGRGLGMRLARESLAMYLSSFPLEKEPGYEARGNKVLFEHTLFSANVGLNG